jgi:hypothetical protein
MWRDQPAVPMPLHEHRDIYAEFEDTVEDRHIQQLLTNFATKVEREVISNTQSAWDKRQQRGDKDFRPRPISIIPSTWLSHMRIARLYACFPYLIEHTLHDEDLTGNSIAKYYGTSDDIEKTSWVSA